MRINPNLRKINARVHSAGHLIDIAMSRTELKNKPTRGHHFNDHPYEEFEGIIPLDQRD